MVDQAPAAREAVPTIASLIAGDLPDIADIPAASFALVEEIRDLVEAAVRTDVGPDTRERAAELVAEAAGMLRAATREQVVHFARHPNGRLEQLLQAGSGPLNPQAPRLEFTHLPPEPAAGTGPRPVEVTGRCTLTAAHGGPPARAHGGVVATLLDHLLGVAASSAGQPGFTAGLEIRYRRATPYDVPLELSARWTHRDGRKSYATGEIRAHGEITAEAKAVFVAPRDTSVRWSHGDGSGNTG
jgi:acyl-coenzyme A thioesterase PaaI-like protein